MCLLCQDVLSNDSMKAIRLKKHMDSKHSLENCTIDYFEKLKRNFNSRKTIMRSFEDKLLKDSVGLYVSYQIALIIAKASKPHAIGETIISPCIDAIFNGFVKTLPPEEIKRSIPLSNSSISRRIDEMAENVEKKLIDIIQKQKFSLQLDECTLMGNESLLMAYVRFIYNEEMLFTRYLLTDTKGQSIYDEVVKYFRENCIPIENIIACATDGAPSMIGKHKGFISLLKNSINSKILCVHWSFTDNI